MAEIATPLSCAQRSIAVTTCCSAAEVLFGSALVRICSQWPRMPCSRCTSNLPWLICLRSSAMRVARAPQAAVSGESTSWSPAKRATTVIAPIIKSCRRSLICTLASFIPLKVKRKLQRRRLPAGRAHIHLGNLANAAQPLDRLQQSRVVPSDAGAGDRIQVANLDGLGRYAAILREGLGEAPQDGQATHGLVIPGAKLPDLVLQALELFDVCLHLRPLRFRLPELALLEEEQSTPDQRHGGRGRDGRAEPPRGVAGGELLQGGNFGQHKLKQFAPPGQPSSGQAE